MVSTSVRSQIAPHVHLISIGIKRICTLGGGDQAEIFFVNHRLANQPRA
jgi:hypothetical protein